MFMFHILNIQTSNLPNLLLIGIGDYTTQNKKNKKKRIRSSTSTPGSTDKQQSKIPKLLEQNILMAIFNH
jgi:hypothetical protein